MLYRTIRAELEMKSQRRKNLSVAKVFKKRVDQYPNEPCFYFEDSVWTNSDVRFKCTNRIISRKYFVSDSNIRIDPHSGIHHGIYRIINGVSFLQSEQNQLTVQGHTQAITTMPFDYPRFSISRLFAPPTVDEKHMSVLRSLWALGKAAHRGPWIGLKIRLFFIWRLPRVAMTYRRHWRNERANLTIFWLLK